MLITFFRKSEIPIASSETNLIQEKREWVSADRSIGRFRNPRVVTMDRLPSMKACWTTDRKGQAFMRTKQIVSLFVVLALALPLCAQMGMGPRMPDMSGIWHPVAGAGGAYEMTDQGGKRTQLEMTIVGKEDVSGKPGYWMEMAMANPRSGGDMFMKYLIAPVESGMTATRMIIQMPGQDPMEMDMSMMNRGGRGPATMTPSDIRDKAERVGTETITVPAGTFSCEHYRAKDGSSDVWVSDKIAPWGLVKMQGKNNSMVLTKVITDAKDNITGTPKKFDPMQMMRDRQGQQGQ